MERFTCERVVCIRMKKKDLEGGRDVSKNTTLSHRHAPGDDGELLVAGRNRGHQVLVKRVCLTRQL